MARWRLSLTLAISLAIGLSIAGSHLQVFAQPDSPPAEAAPVERGRYLVHDVAMCVQCHSDRNENGTISSQRMLRGGPVPVEGPDWTDAWAYLAPDLVTLARGRPEYVIQVLTTGRRPDGSNPKSPMPPFRLTEADARAVVAYLKTLQ